ncbi:pseudouridine synthase [Thiomicrorhabdus immobilis]|uniref:Pseudouridine synthase n=1 Tax=Thiomicrorhabdus immobilis TaxID=2791037 RepID=A0ABM7MAH6_9GAMM|nr:pseudouridine synthase [Thiomicrorhabdus immobilis]BCN92327.1 pseudouridine synthase [Thiomicrorhabdus immobilis]
MHLDRYLSKYAGLSRKSILRLLNLGKIKVDEQVTLSRDHPVNDFSKIHIEGKLLNLHKPARYFLMNKPAGILSATTDPQHTTAIELIAETEREDLHIAGRLDRATTGLLILTNDGKWSRHITEPKQKVPKTYRVETVYAISPQTANLFSKGIYFAYENMTTSPAEIEILSPTSCRLTIYEGRYHQIKRMFAATGNRVKNLHRESVGEIKLDSALRPGDYRALSQAEIDSIWRTKPEKGE